MRRSSGIFSIASCMRSTLLLAGFAVPLVLASPAVVEVVQLTASMDGPHLNLHTGQFPGGEIRGQVLAAPLGSAGGVANLAIAKSGTDLVLSWGADCGAGDSYGVYRGDLAQGYGSIAFDQCSIVPTGATIAMGAPNAEFFLVVPAWNDEEGSYGAATAGTRAPATSACHPQGFLNGCVACTVPCNEGETCFPNAGCIVEYLVQANGLSLVDGLVSAVDFFVATEWLESDDVSLAIEITGINDGFHLHGSQEVLVSATQLLVMDQGDALVLVDWTTDPNMTHSPEDYTVCVQAMVDGQEFGAENCTTFGPY